MSGDIKARDMAKVSLRPALPWRPDPAAARVALQDIVEQYFDDMGLTGEARRQAYADLEAKVKARDVNATQPKERA